MMYYPSSAGSVTSFVTPMTPVTPRGYGYYPAAPMSAVLPGQHYYPTMHSHHMAYPASPVMMQTPTVGYGTPYYGQAPTVIVSSRSGRHRHRHSRSRSRGFLGYL